MGVCVCVCVCIYIYMGVCVSVCVCIYILLPFFCYKLYYFCHQLMWSSFVGEDLEFPNLLPHDTSS